MSPWKGRRRSEPVIAINAPRVLLSPRRVFPVRGRKSKGAPESVSNATPPKPTSTQEKLEKKKGRKIHYSRGISQCNRISLHPPPCPPLTVSRATKENPDDRWRKKAPDYPAKKKSPLFSLSRQVSVPLFLAGTYLACPPTQ